MVLDIFIILISSILLNFTLTYDFNFSSCTSNFQQQSPININSADSLYYDEKYFRFLTNNYEQLTQNNNWQYFPQERAIGISPVANSKNLGYFILVKDWAMYSFELKKILFRVKSEHQIDGKSFDVEMQLIHTLDTNYYPPGRRIDLGLNYLVISIFFQVTDDYNPAISKLFYFMNLENFGGMSRNIKLHHIVQHQPSYLYQGTLTFPECEPSLWLVFSQYHLISNKDFNMLVKKIQSFNIVDQITNSNSRNVFTNLQTPVYRNWNDLNQLTPKPTLMSYNSSSYLQITFFAIIYLISIDLIIF